MAIVDRGVELTYSDLDRRAEALATTWRGAGYRRGDRVATLVGNSADHVVAFFACARAGRVLVPLSWRLTPVELAEQLATSDPALLLVEEETETLARGALALTAAPVPTAYLGEQGVEETMPPPWRTPVTGATADLPAGSAVRDEDPLLMIFTSGSSARPKAAVLSHATCFWTNLSLSRTVELDASDVVLAILPQFHVGGWNVQPLLAWWTGATVVLERTFDPGRVLRLVAEHRVTTMMGVPTHYSRMAEHPRFEDTDFGSLRNAVVGCRDAANLSQRGFVCVINRVLWIPATSVALISRVDSSQDGPPPQLSEVPPPTCPCPPDFAVGGLG